MLFKKHLANNILLDPAQQPSTGSQVFERRNATSSDLSICRIFTISMLHGSMQQGFINEHLNFDSKNVQRGLAKISLYLHPHLDPFFFGVKQQFWLYMTAVQHVQQPSFWRPNALKAGEKHDTKQQFRVKQQFWQLSFFFFKDFSFFLAA